jgi:hypothetical protein
MNMDDMDMPQPEQAGATSGAAQQEHAGKGKAWSEFQRDYRSVAGTFRSWIRRLDSRFGF